MKDTKVRIIKVPNFVLFMFLVVKNSFLLGCDTAAHTLCIDHAYLLPAAGRD